MMPFAHIGTHRVNLAPTSAAIAANRIRLRIAVSRGRNKAKAKEKAKAAGAAIRD